MDDKPPRHWHGVIGDRYEHHNVWVRGGPPQTTLGRRPSLPTQPESPIERRSSNSSDMSSSSSSGNNAASPSVPSVAERRRSSSGSNTGLFSNLTGQKRNSTDASAAERRASYNDQLQQGNFFAKWWDGYTKGR